MRTHLGILAGLTMALSFTPAAAQNGPMPCTSTGAVKPVAANDHSVTQEDYPLLSRTLKEEGSVLLKFDIKEDGSVANVQVATSSGFPRLDEAAIDMANKKWRYAPGMQNCKPVLTAWSASVAWHLPTATATAQPAVTGTNSVVAAVSDYPAGARARGEEGVTKLEVMFMPTNSKPVILLVTSSGSTELDQAAMQIVAARMHGKAADYAGQPLVTTLPIQVVWRLPRS